MAKAPSTPDNATRRTIFGLARDVPLSGSTIRRAYADGYGVYDATTDGIRDGAVYDCTVYAYDLETAECSVSVWDAPEPTP